MNTVSIGFFREDGDFAILATMNNNDGYLTEDAFSAMVEVVRSALGMFAEVEMSVLERQDTPDYVTLESNDDDA
jgi:hypothetical protein